MDLFKLTQLDQKAASYVRSLKHYLTDRLNGCYKGRSGVLDVMRANWTVEEKEILKMYIQSDPSVQRAEFFEDEGECLRIWFE